MDLLIADFDHESGKPVILDEFEEGKDDNDGDYKTPRESLTKSTPTSVRRSSQIQNSQSPVVTTPRTRRKSAPSTTPGPHRVSTPKRKQPQPQRLPTPKAPTPQAKRIPVAQRVPKPDGAKSARRSEPPTPKHRKDSGMWRFVWLVLSAVASITVR